MHERVVVFSGGGTGGHLYPALTLADALVGLRPDVRPLFVGARRGVEARVLPERDTEHLLLPVRGFARREGLSNLGVLPALVRSLWIVRRHFTRHPPELVVVTGGYAGAPAGLTAGLSGIPLVLQEQNSVPGVTTRLLSRWAREVHVAFPEVSRGLPTAVHDRIVHSGNPIRPPVEVDVGRARRDLGLDADSRVILIVGGSQGSLALNRLFVDIVESVVGGDLPGPEDAQLLWVTGPKHWDTVLERLAPPPAWVRPVPYIDDMPLALALAELAVSRAGAMATSEFLAWGVPMVLVPLPTAAADHQSENARALDAAGAAIHLAERGLGAAELWYTVTGLAGDPVRLAAHRKAARERGRPESARQIATALARLIPRTDEETSR